VVNRPVPDVANDAVWLNVTDEEELYATE